MLNDVQKHILQVVADMADGNAPGAVNIRSDGQKAYRHNTDNIEIVSKTDKDGIDIKIKPFTKHEDVHIPVVLTKSGFHDMVYNDFFVGEGSEVTIVAGCGIHNCGDCDSQHDGIHTFYVEKNAKVTYIEKHYGEGEGTGKRILNPQTIVYLAEGAQITMLTSQIAGVDDTKRYTKVVAEGANSEVMITEKLLTHADQHAVSEMDVILNGEGSRTRVISRSVAKEASTQVFYPRVQGNAPCFGHVSCDAIIMGTAKVRAIPKISCNRVDAGLIHEAAIGLGAFLMTCTGAVMMLICPMVFGLLTPVPEVQTLAARVLRIELLAEPLFGASIVAAGALRGAGDTLVPSLLNLGSIWIVRVGSALVLVRRFGLTGMWIAMAVELCIRGLLLLYRQKTSKYYRPKAAKRP